MTTEKQISAALTNRDIRSDALAALIVDTEAAIAQAEQAAEAERAKSLDPLRSPDPAVARQAMEDAAFAADRLRTMLPKLQAKYRVVAARETYAEWASTFEALVPKHAAAAAKLKAIYTEFEAQLVEVLREAKAVDAEVHRVANAKPHHLPQANGDGRNLPTVECAARGLPGVRSDFSLMNMKLPAFDKPNQLAWPPYEVPLAVQVDGPAWSRSPPTRGSTPATGGRFRRSAPSVRADQQREQQERQAEADANFPWPGGGSAMRHEPGPTAHHQQTV